MKRDKEKYNEYMRKYMIDRYHRTKVLKGKRTKPIRNPKYKHLEKKQYSEEQLKNKNKGEEKVVDEIKKEFNLSDPLIREGMEVIKTKAEEKGDTEVTRLINTIEKYEKYVPIVLQFAQGFIQTLNQRKQQVQPQGIQPPEGWIGMSNMQRLAYKYKDPAWYEAGERYEASKVGGIVDIPRQNYEVQQPISRNRQPQNLTELSSKYPEPLPVNDSPPQQSRQNHDMSHDNNDNKKGEDMNTLVAALQSDNAKYIEMGIEQLNALKNKEFEKYLNNPEPLYQKLKMFKILIPIHLKEMLLQTPFEQVMEIIKSKCPKKYAWIEKNNRQKDINDIYVESIRLLRE